MMVYVKVAGMWGWGAGLFPAGSLGIYRKDKFDMCKRDRKFSRNSMA